LPEFIPGLQLNEAFYWEAVRPILDEHIPGLPHSAGLIGDGSDVLGFDTPVSTDHGWGPHFWIFLPPDILAAASPAIDRALRAHLPPTFRGYSTHFSEPDPLDNGVRVVEDHTGGPVNHMVLLATVEGFFNGMLGVDPFRDPEPVDWLTFTEQALLAVTAGKVFHDGLDLEALRRRFACYPREVWLYLLAAQWSLISQEEAFVGRTAQAGDELGSRIVAARLVERFIHLCFLMEKRYTPYSKWLGTAFRRLDCYPRIGPLLENVLAAPDYPAREPWLAQAYTRLADLHNELGITPPLETRTRTYSGWHALRGGIEHLPLDDPGNTRPHQVIFAGRFVDAIVDQIRDPRVRAFVPGAGSVSQFMVESSDALQNVTFRRRLKDDLQAEPS
jgi:hypothetical protein